MSKKAVAILLSVLVLSAAVLTSCTQINANPEEIFMNMETVDINGEEVDASVFKDYKLTFINLWHVNCSFCIDELPTLDRINKEYAEQGIAIKGLYYEESGGIDELLKKEIDEIIASGKIEFQHFTLSDDMRNSELIKNIQCYPTTYVVDSNGKIVNVIEGIADYEGWVARITKEQIRMNKNA